MKTVTKQIGNHLIAFLVAVTPAHAISLLSSDTFATTSEGWQIAGSGAQPTWNGGAGHDGASGFLSHFSDGSSQNSKWLMLTSHSDWLGNYNDADVTAVTFWADNAVGSSLGLRIAFNGPGGWFYSAPQSVTDSTTSADWTQLSYNLISENFTYAEGSGGTGNFASTMESVTRFEIFGGPGAVSFRNVGLLQAGNSSNTIRIDQITAVPEPSVLVSGLAGLALATMFRRRAK